MKFLTSTLLASLFSLMALAQPVINTNIITNPCNGSDGELEVTVVSGLTPPLDFTYYSNFTAITHTNINAMTDVADDLPSCYGVWVQETNNPQMSGYAQVNMQPPFYIDYPTLDLPICPDDQGTIELFIDNGQTPTSVSWYEYVEPVTGAFINNDNPVTLTVGFSYIAHVTDGSGCMVEQIIGGAQGDSVLFVAISDVYPLTSTTQANCTDGTATVTSVSGGTAPYTYEWVNGATTATIDNLSQGYYQVTATDSEGCQGTGWANVQQAVNITVPTDITQATCLENDGAVMAFGSGGLPPYTYEWTNGAIGQLNDGLSGGAYYQVIVTDANGCIGNGGGFVQSSTPITVTNATTTSSCTAATGTATLTLAGGTTPYSVTWNTFPQQTGETATGLAVGSYGFTVVDAVGCVRTGAVSISPESVINASISSADATCPATTGSVFVSVSGDNPPFTYLWNTGATTSSLNNVTVGSYSCTITDAVGCSVVKTDAIQTYSPVHVGVSPTATTCLYACDGQAVAYGSGGTAPYTYSWSNGTNAQTATGFCEGTGGVTATDANGCSDYSQFNIGYNQSNDDCYCTITGTVFEDLNGDCVLDPGEPPMENIMIHCQGFGYGFTDENGVYAFQVPVGSYNISQNVQAFYPLAGCQGNSFDVDVTSTTSGCEYVVDFANEINPIHDIHVVTTRHGNPPVPGNDYTVKMIISNNGTLDEANAIVGYEDDGQLLNTNFSTIAPTQPNIVDFPNWYSATSGFPMLEPGETQIVYVDYDVPTNIPMSTQLTFDDTATYEAPMATWLDDYTPWNNTNYYTDIVVSSYDPNMVEVLPQGQGEPGYIFTTDSVLDYIVHFQNTGTYYAQNVVIKLDLDEDIQLESFVPGYSDHDYTVEISEDREVTFTFANINLPWQSMGEYLSRGMVTYSIKQNPNLAVGTPINCTAAIYFDYNEPVITNTALNTIFEEVGTNDLDGDFSLSVYPNPSTGIFNLQLPTEAGSIQRTTVYDMMGRMVHLESTNDLRVDLSNLDIGHYLLMAETDKGSYRQKLVIRK